ncbi:AI-2E family transporter [Desulfosporosinus sp. BICA1-9]|uniref:AI-2E family transporter n=1 Tax=Desulfosporosinus sp. BICA1-9 TaxID=1531958 RepID=UPI00054B7AB0|nr:AI-2E family transporter [Desulfosporosinus sp. BICA1-9]KJS46541.1 MAG: membrane protein [Peptococcaceae bacterium BRH_c23]KJS78996.1 MAG: membrane protein [Desulfosporosinus sp. BICA1-9]HBW34319.1 AI-2E family transporter [Desulfosporosinus sp.]
MDYYKNFFESKLFKKIISLLLLFAIIISIKPMMNLLLLTFMFSFILYGIQNYIFKKIVKLMPINRTGITFTIFIILASAMVFFIYKYIPILSKQLLYIGIQLSNFDINNYEDAINPNVREAISTNIQSYVVEGGTYLIHSVTNIWKFSLNIFIALILSLFLILEKDKTIKFLNKFADSKIGFIYKYYKKLGKNFVNSFAKVMETQILISLINSFLSAIILSAMGFHQVIGLGFMIFILGIIPVAGVIISLIPLTIIAFKLGGLIKILYVLVMIAVLHAIEAYFLNPKLMSVKTKLPVFFTLVVLIMAEHFLGIWGLLFGIPLFLFFLDLLEVEDF